MAESILYNDYSYLGPCTPCQSCCFMRLTKKSGDSVPLDINWRDVPGNNIGPQDILKEVEYLVTDTSNCEIADCLVGVTPVSKTGAKMGRRDWNGPWSRGRVWGGSDCGQYRIHVRAIYESCGQCFDQTVCVDLVIEDC